MLDPMIMSPGPGNVPPNRTEIEIKNISTQKFEILESDPGLDVPIQFFLI